tara:strand:+ start:343 stop:486 length:144 start_codon:yes stop_codon:yes gene_type:complete
MTKRTTVEVRKEAPKAVTKIPPRLCNNHVGRLVSNRTKIEARVANEK